jgi:hypothetical protein
MKGLMVMLGMWAIGAGAFGQDLVALEDSLLKYYTKLSMATVDADRDSASAKMKTFFIESFNNPETFDYSFSKLRFCTIKSSDNLVRLFNWNQPNQDGTFKYHCFVFRKIMTRKKETSYEWFELTQAKREADKIETKYLNADKWIGALYYDIIPIGKKNIDTYVLLGWEGKDDVTTRKMIDAIEFTGNKVRLGANIFKTEKGTQKRMIYEYSNDISMSIKYYPKKNCIVMDHLSPKNPMMIGVYADYGPDGTYCLFKLEKDKWEYIDDINISEFVEGDDRPFVDPRPNRRRR